jgi:hypothetical protein
MSKGITSCYSIASVSSNGTSGGIVGFRVTQSSVIKDCAALNPSVTGKNTWRVATVDVSGSLPVIVNTVAFSGMTVTQNGAAKTLIKGLDKVDGADLASSAILADGTLGGRFTAAGGWTVANGALPGLGKTVPTPSFISGTPSAGLAKTVAPALSGWLGADKISVSGGSYGDSAELSFKSAAGNAVDGSLYDKDTMVAMDISLLVYDVPQTGTLAAPITITMPIPTGITPSNVRILHYHGGAPDVINPAVNGNGTCTFTVNSFSEFVFVNLLSGTGSGTGDFGPVPRTGVTDITAATAAMYALLLISAGLWGRVLYKRNKKSGGVS